MTSQRTFASTAMAVLLQEFPFSSRSDTEATLRAKAAAYGIGPYDQSTVDRLRRLKDRLQSDARAHAWSAYAVAPVSDLDSFDRARMVEDYAKAFPDVSHDLLASAVDQAIFWYILK
jgi:hypothetical protein